MTNFENASYSSFFPYRRELHLGGMATGAGETKKAHRIGLFQVSEMLLSG